MIRATVNGNSATPQRQQRRNRARYTITQAQLAIPVIATRQHAAVATQKKSRVRASGGNETLGINRELDAAQSRAGGTAESTANAATIDTAARPYHNAVMVAKRNGNDTITARNCHQESSQLAAARRLPWLVTPNRRSNTPPRSQACTVCAAAQPGEPAAPRLSPRFARRRRSHTDGLC